MFSGGLGQAEASCDPHLLAWLRTAQPRARRCGSICTGAFVLAAAGLLEGKRATTHWAMAAEFKDNGVAFNCLWPRTGIATAAIQNILGGEEGMKRCRKPEIMADAAYAILNRPARQCTGNFFIDDEVLAAEGITDLAKYAVSPGTPLMADFFVPAPGARTLVGKGQ